MDNFSNSWGRNPKNWKSQSTKPTLVVSRPAKITSSQEHQVEQEFFRAIHYPWEWDVNFERFAS